MLREAAQHIHGFGAGTTELGRFIATPEPESTVSLEERLTAATVVSLYAGAVGRPM